MPRRPLIHLASPTSSRCNRSNRARERGAAHARLTSRHFLHLARCRSARDAVTTGAKGALSEEIRTLARALRHTEVYACRTAIGSGGGGGGGGGVECAAADCDDDDAAAAGGGDDDEAGDDDDGERESAPAFEFDAVFEGDANSGCVVVVPRRNQTRVTFVALETSAIPRRNETSAILRRNESRAMPRRNSKLVTRNSKLRTRNSWWYTSPAAASLGSPTM